MKSMNGGSCALRGYHGDEAKAPRLLTRAIKHHIHLGHVAVSAKQCLQFVFRRGRGDIFNVYFGIHKSIQSLSEIFIRVAYPVEPFGFKFVPCYQPSILPGGIGDGSGKEPDLFGQLNHGQADEFQFSH
jgi:hypothetical protein